jgi:hypothetical protein
MVVAGRIGKKTVTGSRKKWKSTDFTATFTNGVCKLGIVYESSDAPKIETQKVVSPIST